VIPTLQGQMSRLKAKRGTCGAKHVLNVCHGTNRGHGPYAYLLNGLERLPTHPVCRTVNLLPCRWQPGAKLA
jgi:hypothetical protein